MLRVSDFRFRYRSSMRFRHGRTRSSVTRAIACLSEAIHCGLRQYGSCLHFSFSDFPQVNKTSKYYKPTYSLTIFPSPCEQKFRTARVLLKTFLVLGEFTRNDMSICTGALYSCYDECSFSMAFRIRITNCPPFIESISGVFPHLERRIYTYILSVSASALLLPSTFLSSKNYEPRAFHRKHFWCFSTLRTKNIQRISHGRAEIRNFSWSVEQYFTSERSEGVKCFFNTGREISYLQVAL